MENAFVLAVNRVSEECIPKDVSTHECVKDTNIFVFPCGDLYQWKINRLESYQYLERVKLFYKALVGVN